jgi:hypothetical protein
MSTNSQIIISKQTPKRYQPTKLGNKELTLQFQAKKQSEKSNLILVSDCL